SCGIGDDMRVRIAVDGSARDLDGSGEARAAVLRNADEDGRVRAEAVEVRPWDIDRAVERDVNGFVIGELTVRAARLPVSRECADERKWMVRAAGGPAPATVVRATQPERHGFAPISEACEVGGVAVGAE